MAQFRINDQVKKAPVPFDSVLEKLSNNAQALNENLVQPGAELRACDDAWRYYSAHLQVKDIPIKIRPCEVDYAGY
ncbi:hypothetical protein C1752_10475 [Acaryochloris thomasi RCC1774]|uniref:Uncharacterized protein n=1 Tax=Acaryochloris thomasi RCC1774 TaxID=1764569 RepID=A0A2W1JG55_9CYAN|nr:hypothetical protein [Acaryochloris thomasi]PZD70625.1 hypothetical protein C1752_10475 [Acaryochloris thomasi RCC1774]